MNYILNNVNYSASIQALDRFVDLPNCDNVKSAIILNSSVIVAKSVQTGELGIFFPVESQISKEFLGANNQFRKPEWGNLDQKKKGFFEEHGRVKAVKFRGHKSEGFWIPIDALSYTGLDLTLFNKGDEFESIEHDGQVHKICQKYFARRNQGHGFVGQSKKAKAEDRIVRDQFRLHYDTENLRRNIHKIQPDDVISISSKWHGTSAVISNLLVNRELKWYERWLQRLGVKIQDQYYGIVWSSRKVIKGVEEAKETQNNYYDSDLWGLVAKEIGPVIPQGISIYGEIVGYTPSGGAIQSLKGLPYHYGCQPGQHKFLVYRVTSTNATGQVIELSWPQMKQFCIKYGLEMVHELYYGRVDDWYCNLTGKDRCFPLDQGKFNEWNIDLLAMLEREFAKDETCRYNDFKVPQEGVVIRKDTLEQSESFKLKSWAFLNAEGIDLDAGVVDLETQEG